MYLLCIEIIFVAFILFVPFSLHKTEIPLFSYFSLMFSGCLLFTLLLLKYSDKAKLIFLIFLAPMIIVAGGWLGFPLFGNLLFVFFVFWRTISHHNEHDKQNEGLWILLTIVAGIFLIFIAGISSDSYMKMIGALMISQIIFIMIGGFIRRWLAVETKINNKNHFFLPLIALMAGLSLTGLIFAAGMKLYEKLFFSILQIGVTVLGFISSPFFKWAEEQNWSEKIEQFNNSQGTQEETVIPRELEEAGNQIPVDMSLIGTVIFAVGLILVFFYVYKRKNMKNTEKMETDTKAYSTEILLNKENGLFAFKGKVNPPDNPIRKEIFAFEKFAKKHKLGRLPYESLSDWMNRIEIPDFDDINTIYEKVRYGLSSVSDKEEKLIKEKLQLKKVELKARKNKE